MLLSLPCFGQGRAIVGDTAVWYRWHLPLIEEVGLTDFSTSEESFSLRFSDPNQIVEVHRVKTGSWGTITNFSDWKRRKKATSTLVFQTDTLTQGATDSVLQLYHRLRLDVLPTDEEIEGWNQGNDGGTYFIESAVDSTYGFRHYWAPTSQDSLPEALTLLEFLSGPEKIAHRKRRLEKFFRDLPRKGSYSVGSGAQTTWGPNLRSSIGYEGLARLPVGFSLGLGANYVDLLPINLIGWFAYSTDLNENYLLKGAISRTGIFFKPIAKNRDFLIYNYRQNKLNFISERNLLRSHQMSYGIYFNAKVEVSIGADFSLGPRRAFAPKLGLYHRFSNSISFTSEVSLFRGGADYLLAARANFQIAHKWFSTTLGYEKYLTYKDFRFGLYTSF